MNSSNLSIISQNDLTAYEVWSFACESFLAPNYPFIPEMTQVVTFFDNLLDAQLKFATSGVI